MGNLDPDPQKVKNPEKQNLMNTPTKFELQPLPYAYDALEPFIDKLTVEIHYSKHHKAYFDNFINAIKGTAMESMTIREIFRNISKDAFFPAWYLSLFDESLAAL